MSPAPLPGEAFAPDVDGRRRFGRYYTPAPLVRALFGLAGEALAAAQLHPARCTLVDPSCGPGAFLAAAEARPFARRLGLDLDEDALALARAAAPDATLLCGDAYAEGLTQLREAVRGSEALCVIGNPPYVANSELLRSGRYHAVRDALLPFARDVARGTSIRDDYALFFGVADQLLDSVGGRGVIAFVTSASFVDNFLYAPMRRWLLSRYRLHALVELGPSMFEGARVATALSVWVRSDEGTTRFRHARLSGSVEARLAALDSGVALTEAEPRGEALVLSATSSEAMRALDAMRSSGDPIGSVPAVSLPGLKTRFDELLVAPTRAALEARMRAFFEAPTPADFTQLHPMPERCLEKLDALFAARGPLRFDPRCIRPFARYSGAKHRFRVPKRAMAFTYLARELIPRGDHRLRGPWDPHQSGPKLVFNVREVPLTAAVVEGPACVHDHRHARFAPLHAPRRIVEGGLFEAKAPLGEDVLNLTPRWAEAARSLRQPDDLFWYATAVLNSRAVQSLFAPLAGATEEAPIPHVTEANRAAVQRLADAARTVPSGGSLPPESEADVDALFGVDSSRLTTL